MNLSNFLDYHGFIILCIGNQGSIPKNMKSFKLHMAWEKYRCGKIRPLFLEKLSLGSNVVTN